MYIKFFYRCVNHVHKINIFLYALGSQINQYLALFKYLLEKYASAIMQFKQGSFHEFSSITSKKRFVFVHLIPKTINMEDCQQGEMVIITKYFKLLVAMKIQIEILYGNGNCFSYPREKHSLTKRKKIFWLKTQPKEK